MSTYICGIDEAGRGPVIGPMVMALVAIEEHMEFELSTLGVADSKTLSIIRRKELAEVIRREGLVELEIVSPQDIDKALLDPKRNLNILEAEVSGRLINKMIQRLGTNSIKHVILDCPSTNPNKYLEQMKHYVTENVKLIAEHKADAKYPVASAASIIAKVTRDEEINKIKQQIGMNIGSGYPSDPLTISFLAKHYKDYDFFRTTWEPYKQAIIKGQQQTLNNYELTQQKQDNPMVEEQKKKLLHLLTEGFEQQTTKNPSELLRLQKPGITITLYTNGKLLLQGKDKEAYSSLLTTKN